MPVSDSSERFLAPDDIIVSKTDLKGRILYANREFLSIADYEESEVLNKPHNIIRHPDMPRTVFKYAWDRIKSGDEIFTYVKNSTKTGGYYWVFAHFTPTFADDGSIIGYHSMRRAPDRPALADISALYKELCGIEASKDNRKHGLEAGVDFLEAKLRSHGMSLDEFMFSGIERRSAA